MLVATNPKSDLSSGGAAHDAAPPELEIILGVACYQHFASPELGIIRRRPANISLLPSLIVIRTGDNQAVLPRLCGKLNSYANPDLRCLSHVVRSRTNSADRTGRFARLGEMARVALFQRPLQARSDTRENVAGVERNDGDQSQRGDTVGTAGVSRWCGAGCGSNADHPRVAAHQGK